MVEYQPTQNEAGAEKQYTLVLIESVVIEIEKRFLVENKVIHNRQKEQYL